VGKGAGDTRAAAERPVDQAMFDECMVAPAHQGTNLRVPKLVVDREDQLPLAEVVEHMSHQAAPDAGVDTLDHVIEGEDLGLASVRGRSRDREEEEQSQQVPVAFVEDLLWEHLFAVGQLDHDVQADRTGLADEDMDLADVIGLGHGEEARRQVGESDVRTVALQLVVSEQPTVRWELALVEGQEAAELGTDGFFGYPVDAGVGTLADVVAVRALADWEFERLDEVFIPLRSLQVQRRSTRLPMTPWEQM
jgi:hypothetical protein